jgi:hypothetical protein
VSRGRRVQDEVPEGLRVPPVELDDLRRGDAPPLEVRSDAEGRDEGDMPLPQSHDRVVVEVIVVVVREDHRVERRQSAQRDERRKPALGTGEADRPDAVAPDRITRSPVAGGVAKRPRSTRTTLGGVAGDAFGSG